MFASCWIYYISLRTYYVFNPHYILVHMACSPKIWYFKEMTIFKMITFHIETNKTNSFITKIARISSVRYYISFRSNRNRQKLCKWNDFDGDNYFTWYTRFGRNAFISRWSMNFNWKSVNLDRKKTKYI